jgi:hypothetical protein
MSLTSKSTSYSAFAVKDPATAITHLKDVTGYNLVAGTMARKNQAIATPADYIADKAALWEAIITGDEKKLILNLPGSTEPDKTKWKIPKMSSLGDEWIHMTRALTESGVSPQVANEQADIYTRMMFNQRLSMFSTAFPGLVDEAYEEALTNKTMNSNFNAKQAGIVDIKDRKQEKYRKYKKRARKYKKNRPAKTPAST